MKVLNDPTHVCPLPDPAEYARGTVVQCEEVIVGGIYPGGECGRKYTRGSRWGTATWADYDYGW